MSSPSAKTMLMLCSLVAGRGCVTSEQVSEMMGISMPTASQRLFRASSLGLLVKKTPIQDAAVIRAMKSRKNSLLLVWR